MKKFYLLDSRILTHLIFWVTYYLVFSLIWANRGDYYASFYLEFILLPIRMMAVYVTIYVLIPKLLAPEKYWQFVTTYIGMLIAAGLLQRVFIYLFFESFITQQTTVFFDPALLLRAVILINSTVLFVSAIKVIQLWQIERQKNQRLTEQLDEGSNIIKIKSDKRTFRITANDILFVEGLGNYVIYHTSDQKLISYTTLRDAVNELPDNFIRIHKSYVINKDRIQSYDPESVEINKTMIPVGKSFKGDLAI
ncbi:MAG: LytTR family DNA-binding domain-containing protein [Cyclobacteriaceae bacterium]